MGEAAGCATRAGASAERCRRCGFIAMIGALNAGKSTLVNALVGSKVAIVTHKAQTTRTMVRGIAIEDASQLIFIDTPGIFVPRRKLDRAMVRGAWGMAADADLVCLLVDAQRGVDEEARAIVERLAQLGQPGILVLNKVYDPWHYPEDQISDAPLRQLAAEITREKLYLRLHQELPYQSTVETDVWKDLKDGSVRIEQTIYVERESQRKILLGKQGRTIKAIGAESRREIAEAVEAPVHLFLFVKVREHWDEDPERYRGMGLEFPKD